MKTNNIFPSRLLAARNQRDLNQEQLGKKAKLQPSAISHFENGSRKPSFDNLRRLADALEVTSDYLLGRTDDPKGLMEGDSLFRNYEKLTTREREIARDFLETLAKRSQKK